MAMTGVDFGRHSNDYAQHRPGFPHSFYDRLETIVALKGIAALDLGTGPGVVALELARRGANVIGIDISRNQIDAARHLAADRGLSERARFLISRVEEIHLPDNSFDLATAGQCWGWFDEPLAMREVMRLLGPGGWLIVGQFCYLPRLDEVARATERLILEQNPDWKMAHFDGLYPWRIDALISGGFEFVEQFCYDHAQPFTHESWRGRIRTCNGVGSGAMKDEQVATFDAELAEMLRREFPHEPLAIRHRIWAVVVRKPQDAAR